MDNLDDLDNLEDTPFNTNSRYSKTLKSHVLDKRVFYSNAITIENTSFQVSNFPTSFGISNNVSVYDSDTRALNF